MTCIVQYSTEQYTTVQYRTAQYTTVQYTTGQYSAALTILAVSCIEEEHVIEGLWSYHVYHALNLLQVLFDAA